MSLLGADAATKECLLNCNFHGCCLLAVHELEKRYIVASNRPNDVAQKCKDMNVQEAWRIFVGVTGSHCNMAY